MEQNQSDPTKNNGCAELQGLTLLMVEDDEFFADIVRTKLSAFGCTLIITETGDDVVTLTHKHKPDVLLLDLQLPKLAGRDVLETFKQDEFGANVPVIVFTNSSSEQDIQAVSEAGADEYLIKVSTDLNTLAEIICKVVKK